VKLVYKGSFRDYECLPKGNLPKNAVKFKEADNLIELNLLACIFIIPVGLAIALFIWGSYLLHSSLTIHISAVGAFLFLLAIPVHEVLHAICFGKDAEVEMYFAPKALAAFVVSTHPVSKARFIFLSLFPNVVLGWLPLLIWMLLPYNAAFSNHLFAFAIFGALAGVGDYLNVFNAVCQMPKGSIQQMSGFNSYWYMP